MLFISKKVTQPDFLAFIAAKKIKMVDASMISFSDVPFVCPEIAYDVIFFTSPRSAQFFLNRCNIAANVEIATIGKATSEHVISLGNSIAFTGKTSGNPALVSEDFKKFVGERKVLFPQSDYSQRSMQSKLETQQVIDLIVYKTVFTPIQLKDKPRILVFTSPTNVESFLELNQISEDQKIIAWGNTTAEYLNKKGLKSDFILKYSSFHELKEVLEQHFYSIDK